MRAQIVATGWLSLSRNSGSRADQAACPRSNRLGDRAGAAPKKTVCGGCGKVHFRFYDRKTHLARDLSSGDRRVYVECELRRVDCEACGVKQERLELLASNTKFTKRLALSIGALCRAMPIKEVAKRMNLDWHTVKELEKEYMREQLARAGSPSPSVIGIDEIAIRKRHTYRIVVSDLEKRRAIWFGGEGRSEADMDQFYAFVGPENQEKIRLAVMDMWKPFKNSTQSHAPQAAILFDKFHILRHLGEALDKVRKAEYARVTGPKRKFIKGQKYVLLTHKENLTREGRRNLKLLLAANKRLNTAYLLRESFAQLWDYKSQAWARRFFDNWKSQLRWQRLKPFDDFAQMIERHWDGVAAYCRPENKIALGFVEGLNNKIRVFQRRAYGLRDEDYLRLKILTCSLPEL
jgi:transposase